MGDTENKIPLRSEVAVENTWALEDLMLQMMTGKQTWNVSNP